MIDEIKLILSKDVREVIKSPLSGQLLKIYSTLYLGGGQPRWCEKSQTAYYKQIAIDGIEKATKMGLETINKTCELKPDILIHITALQMHVSNANITDKIAIEGLQKGWFKESNFVKLPETAVKAEPKKEESPENTISLEAVTEEETKVERRGRPSKQK